MKTWIKKKKNYLDVGFDPPTFCWQAPNATATLQRDVSSQQVEKSYFYRLVHIKGAERYYWGRGEEGGWWRGAWCENMGFKASHQFKIALIHLYC